MTAFTTDDVISCPGQNLSDLERAVLVGMANGMTQPEILKATNTDSATLRMIELQVRAKLGAKTPSHMVSRGFVLGVLLPRALCALIVTSCAMAYDQSGNRNRTPLRSRVPTSLARTSRAGSGGRHDRAELAAIHQHAAQSFVIEAVCST